MFSSGSVVVWTSEWTVDLPNGLFRFPVHYWSVGLDGEIETDFGEFPGNETVYSAQTQGEGTFTASVGRPFGKNPVVAVAGDRFYFGSQDAWEIEVWSQTGELRRLIRRDEPPVQVTDDHVNAVMQDVVEEADDSDQARQFRRMFREAPIPDYHPAHGSIYVDALGYLWVEEYRLPDEAVRNTIIFDPDGRMVGSVVLPSGLRILEIGEDYLLGRDADDLGVESLHLYQLTRPD
jgi:hypothetical protein